MSGRSSRRWYDRRKSLTTVVLRITARERKISPALPAATPRVRARRGKR